MPNNDSNYKLKYQELKSAFQNSVDLAYRLGFEDGQKEAQIDQMQTMQAQQGAVEQNANGEAPEAQDGQQSDQQDGQQPMSAHPGGSELDQHINELEGLVSKSQGLDEKSSMSLKKSLEGLKSYKLNMDLKKSTESIKEISRNLHKPSFKISQQANANLSNNSKKALTLQSKIVNDVMNGWEKEEKLATTKISEILANQGSIKKD